MDGAGWLERHVSLQKYVGSEALRLAMSHGWYPANHEGFVAVFKAKHPVCYLASVVAYAPSLEVCR